MAYDEWRANVVDNHDAGSGDTSNWTVSNVTVVGGTVTGGNAKHKIGGTIKTFEDLWVKDIRPHLTVTTQTGTNYFLLANTASMEQVVYASDMTETPIEIKVVTDFKLTTAQDGWDANVLAKLEVDILYSDESRDYFVIPYTTGVTFEGRSLLNSWIRETIEALIRPNLDITSITLTATTSGLTDGLKIDQITVQEFKASTEKILIPRPPSNDYVPVSYDGYLNWVPFSNLKTPAFIFVLSGTLAVNAYQGPVLGVPYICTAIELWAYVAEPEGSGVTDTITVDVYRNGSLMGSVSITAGNQQGSTVISQALAVNDLLNLGISAVDGNAEILTLEVRCN